MALTVHRYRIERVSLDVHTQLEGGHLGLDSVELAATLSAKDNRITRVRIHLTHPGDSTRIVCTKDVIQPRLKTSGSRPGIGVTSVLDNLAVVTCGPIVGFQEGIIDMSGAGADLTPFSQMPLIVLEIDVAESVDPYTHEAVLRHAGLRAAEHIVGACVEAPPDHVEEILWDAVTARPELPRIAYVDMVLSQGLLHDTYVLDVNAREGLPVVVDPRMVIDGGIVSGNCVSASDKNTTFHHQNNPVVSELLRGHGAQWNFVGVVITNEPTRLAEKRTSADAAVTLVESLGATGAIVTKEGFGNPDADLMMIIRGLEQAGIATVAITDEFAGGDGASQSLADASPEADAIISTGNANQGVHLAPMTKTIGPLPDVSRLAGGYAGNLNDDGSLDVELQAIIGATNQLGLQHLTCREL
jgi:glycine reductase